MVKKETTEWLNDLRPEEVERLKELIDLLGDKPVEEIESLLDFFDHIKTVGGFMKYVFYGFLFFIAGLVAFLDDIKKIIVGIRNLL